MILGFDPDAPNGELFVDPVLPEWLPELTVLDLRVGKQNFDLRFWLDGKTTRWEVLRGHDKAIKQRTNLC
jgi:hypothetical protein